MQNVFVYGSLKQGKHNNYFLEGSEYLGAAKTSDNNFKMFNLGAFPAIAEIEDGDRIVGELWRVNEVVMKKLDYLEGYPDFYDRKEIVVETYTGEKYEAIVYFINDLNFVKKYEPVDSGEW